ncbi:MAG: hypothetical protein NTZ83_02125 [Candidatus Pacearchaeota archaeon]|nr:hypothetical protein [Candidatus Pacearchaeota archaeon]
MIVYRKYFQEESSGEINTILEARFRFKGEVTPDKYGIFRETLNSKNRVLSHYLDNFEGLYNLSLSGIYIDHLGKKRTLIVKKRPWKIGLDIKVTSSNNLKPQEMLNLGALNDFILTGKHPKTKM